MKQAAISLSRMIIVLSFFFSTSSVYAIDLNNPNYTTEEDASSFRDVLFEWEGDNLHGIPLERQEEWIRLVTAQFDDLSEANKKKFNHIKGMLKNLDFSTIKCRTTSNSSTGSNIVLGWMLDSINDKKVRSIESVKNAKERPFAVGLLNKTYGMARAQNIPLAVFSVNASPVTNANPLLNFKQYLLVFSFDPSGFLRVQTGFFHEIDDKFVDFYGTSSNKAYFDGDEKLVVGTSGSSVSCD